MGELWQNKHTDFATALFLHDSNVHDRNEQCENRKGQNHLLAGDFDHNCFHRAKPVNEGNEVSRVALRNWDSKVCPVHRRIYEHMLLWSEILLGKGVLDRLCGTGIGDNIL